MNYIYSEFYRLFRMKSFYKLIFFWTVGFFLITALIPISVEGPSRKIYYDVVFTLGIISNFFLIPIISSLLAGKDLKIMKQSVSFGISRSQIYLVKLMMMTIVVLVIILLNVLIGYMYSTFYLRGFFEIDSALGVKILNIIPLALSAIALCQLLDFLKLNGVVSMIIIFLVYIASGGVVSFLDQYIFKTEVLSKIFPSALLDNGMSATGFNGVTFFVGCLWTVAFVSIELLRFRKKDVR